MHRIQWKAPSAQRITLALTDFLLDSTRIPKTAGFLDLCEEGEGESVILPHEVMQSDAK